MPLIKRSLRALALVTLATGLAAPAALASTTQEALIQDNNALATNLSGTLQTMRQLGAGTVKVTVYWNSLAPRPNSTKAPKHFNASNPAAYPAANWAYLDSIDRQAKADGMQVAFDITGPAPQWASGGGAPRGTKYRNVWRPSATAFGQFVHAVGERYDGSYHPSGPSSSLPRVNFWSIWNEPNYGPALAPQATRNNTVYTSASMYRGLLGRAWSALSTTGHKPGRDTVLIGETAPRGVIGRGFPGDFSGTVPITFIQSLYCVTSRNREMTGTAARLNGCPGNAGKFRAENPALFHSSGWAAHLYAQGTPPNTPTYQCGINKFCFNTRTRRSTAGYADFAEVGRLESLLSRLSGHRQPIWNTEYGFWTNPPDHTHGSISPTLAAYYMNWAEYLSYRQSDIASYSQYLLVDPASGQFADGFELANGKHLSTFDAYEVPLYMPSTSARHAASLTVWGAARPAAYALSLHPQAQIQFQAGSKGAFKTLRSVTITNLRGYFDVRQTFTSSGTVRIAWKQPGGGTVYSRTQKITIG